MDTMKRLFPVPTLGLMLGLALSPGIQGPPSALQAQMFLDRPEAGGQPQPSARAVRALQASGSIVLDGRLDEPSWSEAPVIRDFRQIEPVQGGEPLLDTEVRILFDEEHLYVGIEVHDPEGATGVRVPEMRRNFGYFENDLVGISLDGFGDGRSAMAFQVNPYGALRDLRVVEGHLFDREWQGVWDARTRIHEGGWTAELRLPWSTLRYDPEAESWGVMIVRRTRRLNEEVGWPEWPRQNNAYTMRYAGRLEGLRPPPPARNLQLQPYATARTEGDPAAGGPLGDRRSGAVGGDLKWTMTPNTVLDLTANTDFAEADVDREVLDLTRFSVLFPEQRPFFLENGALFRAGGDRWLEPFFTRRIGLDRGGRPIPLDGGLRLTHQSPQLSGGAMLLRQRGAEGSPTTHFGVGRFQRNLGAEHRVGALAVSRVEEGGEHNHVGALDFFYRPRGTTFLRGMVSGSRTTGIEGGDGWSAFAHLSNNFSWGYVGWVQVLISPEYRASTGFVPRQDLVTTSPAVNLDLRPHWLPRGVRSYRPGFTAMIHHRVSDREFEEGWLTLRPLLFQFHDGSEASLWLRGDQQRLERDFRPIPGLEIGPGSYDFATIGFTREPDQSRPYWTFVTLAAGGFFDGRTERIVYRASPVRNSRFGVTFDYTGNRFRRVGGDPDHELVTHLLGLQLRASLDPRTQVSTFHQRNTVTGHRTLNARFSWEFAPLSFVHLVVNDGRPVAGNLLPDRLEEIPRDRQVLLKISYLWQM
jgi:hypothetical protein